ncbi:MAG: helix-turn-helix domain-containing protein, partial [Candidatus Sericytochromatia bacterium]
MASLHEVGQALKEAREAQGRTQEEIAETTRIATRHIRAIEEGNEKELPEVFYIRSFLKKYADAVGLSASEVADAYSKAPVPTTTTPSLGMTLGPIVYYIAVIGLIGGVLALAWHFQPKVSVVSEPSPTPTPTTKPSPTPTPTPKPGTAVP